MFSIIHNKGVLTKVKRYVSMKKHQNNDDTSRKIATTDNASEEVALNYLASILVSIYLDQRIYEHNRITKTSSDILPSVNEGTS